MQWLPKMKDIPYKTIPASATATARRIGKAIGAGKKLLSMAKEKTIDQEIGAAEINTMHSKMTSLSITKEDNHLEDPLHKPAMAAIQELLDHAIKLEKKGGKNRSPAASMGTA